MKASIVILLACAFIFLGCSTSSQQVPIVHKIPTHCKEFYDMKAAQCIDEKTFIERIKPYRVLFFGDHHNKQELHRQFAHLLEDLAQSGRNISLANEWFTPKDNQALQNYIQQPNTTDIRNTTSWRESKGRNFSSYSNIYKVIQQNNGMLYGINIDNLFRKKISRGNRNLFTLEQKNFYNTLDLNLYPHKMMLAPFFSHCHSNANESAQMCKKRMYRVQVAWDTYMAQQSAVLAKKLLHNDNDLFIVFAGSMHMIYGVGINARFARLNNEPFVSVIPATHNISQAQVGTADFLIFYNNH